MSDAHPDFPLTAVEPIVAGGVRWNCAQGGHGPPLLLLHGTGGTVNTWTALSRHLCHDHRLIALDLPGHGNTTYPGFQRITCASVATLVADAVAALGIDLAGVVAHSAGAAVMLQMAAGGALGPDIRLVGINPALQVPPDAARALMRGTLGDLLRSRATRSLVREAGRLAPVIELLLSSTGSRLTAEQERAYIAAFAGPHHAEAAFAMMANWDLSPLRQALPSIHQQTLFIVGERDAWIPPSVAHEAAALMPRARVEALRDAGHLVHEERPAEVAALIAGALRT